MISKYYFTSRRGILQIALKFSLIEFEVIYYIRGCYPTNITEIQPFFNKVMYHRCGIFKNLSGECINTLYGHASTVRCMAMHGNQVVSGSRDNTLRVWDISTFECKMVLVGHLAAVRCVCFDGKKVVSGSYDNTVRVSNFIFRLFRNKG